jgi:hypothetical protein
MKLTKTGIVEYIVVFVGTVGLLAYIHATATAYQSLGAAQSSPMMIERGRPIRGDAGQSAVRFREVALADARL